MKQAEKIAEGSEMTHSTIYIELTSENFPAEVLNSGQIALVKFGADWLGTCSIMAPILEKLNARFGRQVKFCRVDVDKNSELASFYNITYLPTFIFFKNGQVVDKIERMAPEAIFLTKINDLLRQDDKE